MAGVNYCTTTSRNGAQFWGHHLSGNLFIQDETLSAVLQKASNQWVFPFFTFEQIKCLNFN